MMRKKHGRRIGATAQELKLMPHLIPKPLFRKSAANLLSRSAWGRIKADTLEVAHHTCQACDDADNALDCHEMWDYDEERGTATLIGLRMQCEDCHLAVHMGLAVKTGRGNAALTQLMKVNGIDASQAKALYHNAMDEWRRRNKIKWRIVVGEALLERYPELGTLEALL